MIRYEALLVAVPELTADEAKSIEQQLTRLIESQKATLISFERWGKFRMAYPVQNNEYGVYFLARFETIAPNPLLADVKTLLEVKLHELVMRSMRTRLNHKASLSYNRPPSLEEGPSRDVGAFFKDNHKIESHVDSEHAEDDIQA